jgi:uncharacterized protein (UPF0276 family)
MRTGGPAPSLGFSYGGRDPALLHHILPVVDVLEVTPDDLVTVAGDEVALDDRVVDHLRELSHDTTIVVHGVGLSIGSYGGYSQNYLRILSDFVERVDVAWHSEHLGFTTVEESYLGAMLTLPRTEEVLELLSGRAAAIRSRFGIPFLLENVAGLLPDPGGEHSPAGFLNALAAGSGCGLLLDLYNLECDAANTGLDVDRFLDELDLSVVGELHVAGGVQHFGLQLDVHSRLTRPSTRQLTARVGSARPGLTTVFELLPQAVSVLGHPAIETELRSLHVAQRVGA